jgi:hypothetical protein
MALKDLVKSTEKIEDILESVLKGKIDLVKEGRNIKIHKEFIKKFDNGVKILLYLAGKFAWSLLDKKEYWVMPKELEANLFISGGSIRPLLMKFKNEKFVDDNKEKNKKKRAYKITSLGILELENLIEKYEKTSKK